MEAWPRIDFIDDRERSLFTATVRRPVCVPRTGRVERIRSVKSSVKTEEQILALLEEKPRMTIPELAELLSLSTRAVEKQIANIRKEGKLRRVGPKKGGH